MILLPPFKIKICKIKKQSHPEKQKNNKKPSLHSPMDMIKKFLIKVPIHLE